MVPEELKQLPQWVVWRREEREGKLTKVPYRADGHGLAAADNPQTWATAWDAYNRWKSPNGRNYDGIGFVVCADDPYCGIDLDHCRNAETSEIEEWAQEIVERFSSYTEITPSQEGLRIFIKGELPPGGNRKGKLEIYDCKRYFTTTGEHLPGTPESIEERQQELNELHGKLFPLSAAPKASPTPISNHRQGQGMFADWEVISRASQAANGPKFKRLMSGDISGHGNDDNRADMALCSMLAFWWADFDQIDRIFRSSGLYREKWERASYREPTIRKALEETRERYTPPEPRLEIVPAAGQSEPAVEQLQIEPIKKLEAWPKPPAKEAFYGLAGEVVHTIDPYSEADPIAVLGQFLAFFGIAVGTRPYFSVGATRHAPRLFVGVIGRSAKARKGDSWAPIERLMLGADPSLGERILGGFGSGEAMVHAVRDPRYEEKNGTTQMVDQGATDKRLLMLETELSRLLVAVGRDGSTVSQMMRDAYDGRPLRNLVKRDPASATGHHIGVVGHSTVEELRGRLNEDQIRNGFANRFLWLAVQRSKRLPSPPVFGGEYVDRVIELIGRRLQEARRVERMYRSEAAEELWEQWYDELSDDGKGTIGVLTERAEAIVLHNSMIYALTDGSEVVLPHHLEAARAVWDYSTRSVAYIFGGATGNIIADRILEELAYGPLTRTAIISELFHKNLPGGQLEKALGDLEQSGRVVRERVATAGRGRPAEVWRLPS